MRTLLLTRGAPGAGKSTFLKNHGLELYTISPDSLRLLIQSPTTNANGRQSISQNNDSRVWELVFEVLEERMKRGEFTVIDATHSRTQLINRYRELARKYRYRVKIVDFSEVPLETLLNQNKSRPDYKFVPERAIEGIYERMKFDKPGSWCEVISHNEFSIKDIEVESVDVTDKYKAIQVIGDVHGCYTALAETIGDFNEDTMYIFVGDLLDRGIENFKTFKYIQYLIQQPNVFVIEGNHETHWRNLERGSEDLSHLPFNTRIAIKELLDNGITIKDIKSMYSRLIQLSYFTFHNKTYVVTHGGIVNKPSVFTATQDYIKGVGAYEEAEQVNKVFIINCPDLIQIHGHRNIYNDPIQAVSGTYNLCDKVEFGGYLRSIIITKEGIEEKFVKNNIFKLPEEKEPESVRHLDHVKPEYLLEYFSNHKGVAVKQLENNISSVNFTNKVFQSRKWDSFTCKARGLFLDENSNIVARSYDKFFNYKEMEETRNDAIKKLEYPLVVYAKENGFLGILSVHNKEWFIASKSTNTGLYAEMFRELVTPYLTDKLKEYIIKNKVSFVFEVNHLNDPHLVKYNKSHIVLLDIIYNKIEFEEFDYIDLKDTAKYFGFNYKQIVKFLYSYKDWRRFREEQKAKSITEPNIEGWVLQDANGFQFKLKSNFYTFWKRMRALKDRVYKKYNQLPTIQGQLHNLDEFKVFNFFTSIPKEDLQLNIIELYERYLNKK